ncbi:alpha/beta-hydrolase family protein [Corynebacterium sp. 335C]
MSVRGTMRRWAAAAARREAPEAITPRPLRRRLRQLRRASRHVPLLAPGLVGAQVASWAAFTPSLMPRPTASNALTTFMAQLSGHVIGLSAGLGLSAATARLRRTPAVRALIPSERTTDLLTVAGQAALTGVTAVIWARSVVHQATIAELVGYDALAGRRGQLRGTAIATGAYLATRGFTALAELAYDGLNRLFAPRLPRYAAPALAGAIVGATIATTADRLVVRRIAERVSRNAARLNSLVMPGRYQPWEPERSGSPWSMEPWHALGAQGRSFVSDGPRRRDIAAVTDADERDCLEPIRLYAGRVRGRTVHAQAELIVRELHRTGAFRRDHLVVYTSTGTGWVPEWALSGVEFLLGGDCAQVSMQYSDLPSPIAWITARDNPVRAGRVLFERVRAEWARLPAADRPMLIVAGESLGGYGGNGAFEDADEMLALVDGAVWSGTPAFTPIWKELTTRRDAGSPAIAPVVDGGRHIRFATRPAELWEDFHGRDLGEWRHPRVVYMQHASDPIVWWDWPLAWRRPAWLRERVGRDVIPSMRWWPLVTFWQVLVDGLVSVDVADGHGHRYEAEALHAWAAVLGLPFDDDRGGAGGVRFERIEKWIRRNTVPK